MNRRLLIAQGCAIALALGTLEVAGVPLEDERVTD